MLKKDILKIYDEHLVKGFAYELMTRSNRVIPAKYNWASRMYITYGAAWWKHMYLDDILGKCLFEPSEIVNAEFNIPEYEYLGKVLKIDTNNGIVYFQEKDGSLSEIPHDYLAENIEKGNFVVGTQL